MAMRRFLASLTVLAMILSSLVTASPARAATDEQIAAAIDRLKASLYRAQRPIYRTSTGTLVLDPQGNQPTGMSGWFGDYHSAPTSINAMESNRHVGGPSAIATLALLVSGESMQTPRLQDALRYLRAVEMNGVYALSLRMHVWSYLPDIFRAQLQTDATAMLGAAHTKRSTWHYTIDPVPPAYDHSTTQYGILGVWQAAKRGIAIPPSLWQNAERHFIQKQFPDGGWAYSDERTSPSLTMTCAGLTCQYVVLQEMYRDRDTPPTEVMESINKGLAWLNKYFDPAATTASGPGYYIYGIERVGLASGVRFFRNDEGDHDWFELIADRVINSLGREGGTDIHNPSFNLMFLARGRVPVWITKLQMPGVNWNNRPNDLHFLTRYLSDARERELNWQSIPIDINPEKWINAPMAYLASDQEIRFTDQQKAQIKRFIDLGGTLLCNPDMASPAFIQSIQTLAAELYPQYQMTGLPPDHPLYTALFHINTFNFMGVHNGARDLILLSDTDIGKPFQMDTGYEVNDIWKLAINLFSLASDYGVLTNRLVTVIDAHPGTAESAFKIARARYDGNWNAEPGAWWPIAARLSASAKIDLELLDIGLEEIAGTDAKLVHLTGVEPVTLTDAQKAAIEAYVKRGGTILIENVGGRGLFSIEMDKQLRNVFKVPSVLLRSGETIISGDGLPGGVNCSSVTYRRRALLNAGGDPNQPRLTAFKVNDRPAVLISHEDLSLGSLRARQMGISGYQPQWARSLLSNIVLWAQKQSLSPGES